MENLKKYLLITAAIATLFILSTVNRGSDKAGPCCPFTKQNNALDKVGP